MLAFVVLFAAGCGASRGGGAERASTPSTSAPSGSTSTPSVSTTLPSATPDAAGSASAPAESYESRAFAAPTSPTISQGVTGQGPIHARPGLLTAGEWNDNRNYGFILDLVQSNKVWEAFAQRWRYNIANRIQVYVSDGETPIVNTEVELLDADENLLFKAKTDNKGMAYLFINLYADSEAQAAWVRAGAAGGETMAFDPYRTEYDFILPQRGYAERLDLMLVIDTTGSMSDELDFLKSELDDVIQQVAAANANLPIRLSINVYRDIGDEYIIRAMPFEENIPNQLAFLNEQYARGGGDFEEAVELALADAIEGHAWHDEATAKIMLLVLDAPPHNTQQIRDEMHRLTLSAAQKGIRIIPVASSGIDKHTEFLLRSIAMATGGSYVFLTDDSGIGGAHLEPTIGDFSVELLNELLVRLLNEYLQ